jgi:rare lipoprotein A
MTAAHQYLPLGTWVAVESLRNGRVAEVRINDRGPFAGGRILDLSYAAARILGAVGSGVIPVRLRVTALADGSRPARVGTFAVQVGSFTTEERALALRAEVNQGWTGTRVRRAEVGGRPVFRVRVGRFATRQEAERLAQDLAAAGHAVLVVED